MSARINDYRLRLIGIPVLSLAITLLTASSHGTWTLPLFIVDWAISLYLTSVLWLLNRTLWHWLLRRFPHVDETKRRLWMLAGLSVLGTSGATVLLRMPLHWLLPQYFHLDFQSQLSSIFFNLFPTVAVLTLYETLYFFRQWEQNVRRSEQLQSAGTQSQLEALQSQLDPHFLFNTLNTLSALIEPDNKQAQQFVEQLADVYRYVLLTRDKPTVPLAEELAFVDTYLALHKVRFRDNLRITVDVPAPALGARVAPLSVQLLVENALKHNVASRDFPLELRLSAHISGSYFTVENTLRPRTAGLAPSTGMGLANVRHRYQLLQASQPVVVSADKGFFRVQLPLLPE
ncbi:histidine kinase [Hymenobacter tibetensis]|uniref:Histidine kinase n=1 Tax=Hymenobacter tibetensis TaxID=497967 RepID=A0ABY4CWQ5_9BACT|nr:histidine kinase [Hymenobacter tibetensis]UOG73620.1 histidine kinase [Hymenobacter tibetensis]